MESGEWRFLVERGFMKSIKIHHFGGKQICATWDEAARVLEQTVDGVNEFFIAEDHTMFPYLTVLTNGPYAYVICVPNDQDAGLQAYSEDAETGLDPDAISVFYTNTPSEEIEIYNDYVIPKSLAIQIVKEFMETGTMSSCVEWEEL